ncbi:hypothetical protein Tco_0552809 [Tanacetum coccineum]
MPSHLGTSNYQSQMPTCSATPYWQPPMHLGNSNLQPPITSHPDDVGFLEPNILNRGRREQRPNIYLRTPFMKLPPTTVLPKKRGDRAKNKVKNANLSPLNLGNVFANDNVGDDDVMFLGGRFTGNYLCYDNVDRNKVTRGRYIVCMEFLSLDPHDIYLDCYMRGYSVTVPDRSFIAAPTLISFQ